MKKNYVKIQSTIDIMVNPGLTYKNLTKKDSDIQNRLKVNSTWPKSCVLIQKGQHIYPAEIVKWNSVKALEKNKVLTIGEYIETPTETPVITKEKLELSLEEKANKNVEDVKEISDVDLDKLSEN